MQLQDKHEVITEDVYKLMAVQLTPTNTWSEKTSIAARMPLRLKDRNYSGKEKKRRYWNHNFKGEKKIFGIWKITFTSRNQRATEHRQTHVSDLPWKTIGGAIAANMQKPMWICMIHIKAHKR